MSGSVFDASALMKLLHEEPGTRSVRAAYEECVSQPMAPDWAMLECSQALWRKAKAGVMTAEQALRRYEALAAIGMRLLPTAPHGEAALTLALAFQHPVYDCAYVALALVEDAALVTADAKQREVAEAAGVEVLWVDPAAG